MKNFQNLDLWREAHALTLSIYSATSNFPDSERFGVTSQIRRAAASIPTNIAEGCGRHTETEFARFIDISMGSAKETEYLLILAKDLRYLIIEDFDPLMQQTLSIQRMGAGLLRKIRVQ